MTSSESRRGGVRAAAALALVALLLAGCGGRPEESARMARRTMTVDTVPDVPRAAATKALPDVEFEDAWANIDRDGALNSYELRGRSASGRIREVRVAPDGEILEMEGMD